MRKEIVFFLGFLLPFAFNQGAALVLFVITFLWLLVDNDLRISRSGPFAAAYIIYVPLVFMSIIWPLTRGVAELQMMISLPLTLSPLVLVFVLPETLRRIWTRGYIVGAVCISLLVIIAYFLTGQYTSGLMYFVSNRGWGYGIIPGWPNVTAAVLFLAIVIAMDPVLRTSKMLRSVLFLGILLTTSRGGILALVLYSLLWALFGNHHSSRSKLFRLSLFLCLTIALVVGYLQLAGAESKEFEALFQRLIKSSDRMKILDIALHYILSNSMWGTGGMSLDLLYPGLIYNHTHNSYLEIALRYGIPAMLMYTTLFLTKGVMIKDRNLRIGFFVFLFISLFQIYLRNFIFLTFLALAFPVGRNQTTTILTHVSQREF